MKKLLTLFVAATLSIVSCQEDNSDKAAPKIPPVESMVIDFGKMGQLEKSATFDRTNWVYSATTVGFWNLMIGTTFAVPVAALHAALDHEPKVVGDLSWQWEYNVDGFTGNYKARLVGKLLTASKVEWKMYIGKTGIDPFEEFLWFEGTSDMDGNSGQWILYHSAQFPEETIQIDWQRQEEQVGEIKYTYVREKTDKRQNDPMLGSTLSYGLQTGEFDIYVLANVYNNDKKAFSESWIEWGGTSYNGHVKAPDFFGDEAWHCWDSSGMDTECE